MISPYFSSFHQLYNLWNVLKRRNPNIEVILYKYKLTLHEGVSSSCIQL